MPSILAVYPGVSGLQFHHLCPVTLLGNPPPTPRMHRSCGCPVNCPDLSQPAPSHCSDSWLAVAHDIKPSGNPSQTSFNHSSTISALFTLYSILSLNSLPESFFKTPSKCTPRPPLASSLFSLPTSLALMPSTLTNLNMTLPLLVPALRALLPVASADLLS